MRGLALVPLLAVAGLAVAGCGYAVAGSPAPTTGPSTSVSDPSTGTSAAIDPCTLLTDPEVQQFGLVPSGRDTAAGGRDCNWSKRGQYSLGVEVFDHDGLGELSSIGRSITNYPVGSHDGRQVSSQGGGCGVYIQITKTSIVAVAAADVIDETQSCQLADQYATLIERRLPVEQR